MAYFDGDMDAEQMPIVDRMDTEYTIYVNSLPPELNKDGIRDIFGQYGEIVAMYVSSNRTWAYITYKTYREAELAIRELNDRKPLCLKVALSKKEKPFVREEQKSNRSEINFENSNVPVNTADSLPIHSDMRYHSTGHGQQSTSVPHKHVMPQITLPYRCADYGSLPHVYEIEEPYMNSNKLWTRGVITVTPDGKRHVSLGRGYTFYEYPEPYPKIEESISKVYEQRTNGMYEYSEDKFKDQVHSCSVCSTKTLKHCEKCHTYYCSKACQLEDWPRHQAECERIPALVEEVNGVSLQINQSVNQIKKASISNVSKTAKSASDVKLRRPNIFNATQAESSSNMSGNINMHKIDAEVTHNSVNNIQDKHVSAQHDNDINVSQTKIADQSIVNTTHTKECSQQHRLQRYNDTNKNIDQSRTNNGCSSPSISTDQNHHSHNYQSDSNKTTFKERYDNDSNVRDRTYNNNNRNTPQKSDFKNNKGSVNYNDRENTNRQSTSSNISMNNDFYKDTHLSKTKFITVEVVIPLKNGEYWVSKLEDADARIDLMVKLQDVVKNSRKLQPIIGEVYGVMYETIWCRALVKSLNPTMVHYIDFGNDEELEENADIRDIGDLIKSPKFARKIRLTQGTSDKYRNLQESDQISVRMLSMDSEKTIIVEVEEEKSIAKNSPSYTPESASNNAVKEFASQENSQVSPNKNTKASMVEVPTVLDVLAQRVTSKGFEGYIQIHEFKNNVYSATLSSTMVSTEMEMIFDDMQKECTKMQTSANYKPRAEDLVCGYWNKEWHRGFISTSETSKRSITAIDVARTLSVDEILPCPKKFLNVFSLGITCEINHSTIKLQTGEVYKFIASINETSYKSLKIEIIANSEAIQAVARPWYYANLSPSFELKNGSKVCLTSYRNHYYMFVRSLEEEEVEHYNNVMQSVAQYAQTAPCLKSPLNTDVVIAPFEDGNNYRAIILKTYNGKAKIVYIDFGNVTEIDLKDLKVMPQLCGSQKSCATRIFLKDVPHDVPLNQEVDVYLRNLSGKEVPLICTFKGSSKDGMCLTTLTGECVNDRINQLLIPGWKRENNDDNTCYMLSDIKIASLGRVGDTVEALVLFVRKDDDLLQYMVGPFDVALVTHIVEVMPAKLKEYCEKTEYYIPRAQELCLAFFDGIWYRAACLNPKESYETSEILFIDYGNIESIKHTDIRLMPKDFIVPEALANLCTVVNLAPVDSNGKYSKAIQNALKELIQLNMTINIKIVECLESGDYKIELPDIRAELIKHRLVKSS